MGQCRRSWGAIVGGAAPVSKLGPMECAATGGSTGETVLLRGANTVCRWRVGRAARGGTAKEKKCLLLFFATVNEKELDVAANLALSSVLSSMGGSVLFDGCPDDDMDLV